ncbi:hypothetical protein GALL_524380 [mine drainage metagenome]|uniref:Uncharacterized protein n=1 Tax=mine drainage metagenome TaxID=410659 RepID=A0A1J5P5J6_9ZZZZ
MGVQRGALQSRCHVAYPLRQAVDVMIEACGAAFGEGERPGGGAQRVHPVQQHLPRTADFFGPGRSVDQVDVAQRGVAFAAEQIEHRLQHALAVFAHALQQSAGGGGCPHWRSRSGPLHRRLH